jgi:transcriptional regulator with XRE-family HTH domain
MVSSRRGGPTLRRRQLGMQLRRLRETAGITIDQVAGKLECLASKISRIETGQTGVTPRDDEAVSLIAGMAKEL